MDVIQVVKYATWGWIFTVDVLTVHMLNVSGLNMNLHLAPWLLMTWTIPLPGHHHVLTRLVPLLLALINLNPGMDK